jgi:hypothetical protein
LVLTALNLAICGCKDTNVFRIVVQLIEKKLPLHRITSTEQLNN